MLLSIVNRAGIIDTPDPHEVLLLLPAGKAPDFPYPLDVCSSLWFADASVLSNSQHASNVGPLFQRFLRGMRATQGAFIAGSALNIILGFSGLWGITMR